MSYLRLKNPNETPPGYWTFPRHPDHPISDDPKDYIWGGDLPDLVAKVHEFRVVNRLELGDPIVEVQDWICRNRRAHCVPANPAKPQAGARASGTMVARFLSAMAAWMVSKETVSQEEAERRAEVCGNCERNTEIDDAGCLGCFGLIGRIINIIGDRKTRVDSALKNCNICGCVNAVQVFVPLDILARAHHMEDFPESIGPGNHTPCWKREWLEKQNAG